MVMTGRLRDQELEKIGGGASETLCKSGVKRKTEKYTVADEEKKGRDYLAKNGKNSKMKNSENFLSNGTTSV